MAGSILTSIAAVSPHLVEKGSDYLKDLRKRAEASLTEQKDQSSTNPNLSQEDKQKAQQQALYGTMIRMAAEDASSLKPESVAQGIGSTLVQASKEVAKTRADLVDIASAGAKGIIQGDSAEFVAKTKEKAAEYVAKAVDAGQAAKEAIGEVTKQWEAKGAQDPDQTKPPEENPIPAEIKAILEDAEKNNIGGRETLQTLYDTKDAKVKADLEKKIKQQGIIIGQDVVQHGHLRLHEFSLLANKGKPEKEGEEGKPDGTYGKSKLQGHEFLEGMAKLGFLPPKDADDKQKAAHSLDAIFETTQKSFSTQLQGTKLGSDGDSLALLFAANAEGKGKNFSLANKDAFKDLDKNSAGFKMLIDGQAMESLKDVKKEQASAEAHKRNSQKFQEYGGNTAALKQLGIKADQMDQFSGATYAVGTKDFAKLSNQEYKNQVKTLVDANKDKGGLTLNVALNIGSQLQHGRNDYADSARGHEFATLSQLTGDRGLAANKLNQLSLVGHGFDGLMANLNALEQFQKDTGANINLDLGMFTHSNANGEMVLGKEGEPGAVLNAAQAKAIMDKVSKIVGEKNAANITCWGCYTNKNTGSASTMFEAGKGKVGSLTVTGTEGTAYSSAGSIGSSDSTGTIKRDNQGNLMTQRITTNGAQGDTKVLSHNTEAYKAEYKAAVGSDLSAQQFSPDKAQAAKETNDKIAKLPGTNRADNNDPKEEEGEGSVNLSAAGIAEAVDRKKEEVS